MSTIVWVALGAAVAVLVAIVAWWIRATRRRCPIDGSIRCRHCRYEDEDGS